MEPLRDQPGVVFLPSDDSDAGIEICVNFGLLTGRDVTGWEIERLGVWLLDEVDAFTAIAEHRHQIGKTAGGSIHLVRVEIPGEHVPEDDVLRRRLEERLVERMDYWARTCFDDRHSEVQDM
jgi:hypothetical protein